MAKTDPEHWFLPSGETPRDPTYTSNNKVEVLTEGEAYFSHLAARLNAMRGGYLHITGYRISPSCRLLPAATPPGPLLGDQLVSLVKKGVTVRVAVWYLPTAIMTFLYRKIPVRRFNHHKDNVDIVRAINAAKPSGSKSAAILDQRLPFPFSFSPTTLASHHQKTVILKSGGIDWAYVGSIDLAVDRWDTSTHSSHPARTKEYWDAYHDIQCVIRGPAVTQVWENFRQRWNDRTAPAKPPSPLPIFRPPPITARPPVAGGFGTHHVQVLRTLACGVYPFAPRGEQTARLALERAIGLAEHYIYIEEQFLWPCSVVDALRTAVRRNSRLKVVILLAEELEFGMPLRGMHHDMRNESMRAIKGSSSGQVFFYCLQQLRSRHPIYVHSKLTIIDDRYVAVGSVNVNKRSHTTDSELHLGVIDGTVITGRIGGVSMPVCKFARDLRVKLWGEHLGITKPGRLEDPISAVGEWPDWSRSRPGSPSRVHHTLCYHPRDETLVIAELLKFLRDMKTAFPVLLPRYDTVLDAIILLLEAVEKLGGATVSVTALELILGTNYLLFKRFLRDFVMNIETTC